MRYFRDYCLFSLDRSVPARFKTEEDKRHEKGMRFHARAKHGDVGSRLTSVMPARATNNPSRRYAMF